MYHKGHRRRAIALIDEQPLFLSGLKEALTEMDGVEAFPYLPGADLDDMSRPPRDLIICDPYFTGRFNTSIVAALRGRAGGCHIMVLTSVLHMADLTGSLAAGASSFMLKSEPIETIRTAVDLVSRGGTAFSAPVVEALRAAMLPTALASARNGLPSLTSREREVLTLVAKGLCDTEISRGLAISPRTVQQHVGNAMRKLNCRSRTEAAVKASPLLPGLLAGHLGMDGESMLAAD